MVKKTASLHLSLRFCDFPKGLTSELARGETSLHETNKSWVLLLGDVTFLMSIINTSSHEENKETKTHPARCKTASHFFAYFLRHTAIYFHLKSTSLIHRMADKEDPCSNMNHFEMHRLQQREVSLREGAAHTEMSKLHLLCSKHLQRSALHSGM